MKNKITMILAITFSTVLAAQAQVATGGTYTLDQSIVSAGGGTSADSTGGVYKLDGVIGEPIAGTTSSNSPYVIRGGFLNSPLLGPTAAEITIRGRVITPKGLGLLDAPVTLTDMRGVSRTFTTLRYGTFFFDGLEPGETYVITVSSRLYTFQPQVITPMQNLLELEINAQY